MKSIDDYQKAYYAYTISPYKDEDYEGFYGKYKDLPVEVFEDTAQEVIELLDDAKREWFAYALEKGIDIPLPSVMTTNTSYSGRMTLRTSKSLHQKLVENASEENVSLNAYIVQTIERGLSSTRTERMFHNMNKKVSEFIKQKPANEYTLASFDYEENMGYVK